MYRNYFNENKLIERIEMKTSIEWDKGKNSFAPKYAELYAILNSG